ncbi:MAG: helix-turn-helix transcriptional regulator [Clostridia bacterium]|nr:helix-turn-helix transcriptional regulator [Clostridia bacterium]
MLDQKVFGEKLRNHRKKLGMTQEEVAEKVGVSPQAISKWEAGVSHK